MSELPPDREGWRLLLARVTRRTRRPDLAEDLLHSAYIKLQIYRRQNRVDNPSAFLVRVAVNQMIDEYRRDQGRTDPQASERLFDLQDLQPPQDEVIAARQRLAHAQRGIAALTPRTREIFLMHRLEGMKYREIAAQLQISTSAVEKHIAKAALFLADWMEDC